MAPETAVVERALLALPPRDRAAVIRAGLLSLDEAHDSGIDHSEVDSAWRDEFRRRIDDIKTGKVELVSHEETVTMARALLTAQA